MQTYYRVSDTYLCNEDIGWLPLNDLDSKQLTPYVQEYVGYKKTPCGCWVIPKGDAYLLDFQSEYGKGAIKKARKFILDSSVRKHAYPDIKDAFASWKYRKERQVSIIKFNLEYAQKCLEIAEHYTKAGNIEQRLSKRYG